MIDIIYYNNEVDKILWDILGNESFDEKERTIIIDTIVETIHLYDKSLKKNILQTVVEYIVENKFRKYYVYDTDSMFNKIRISKSITSETNSNTEVKKIKSKKTESSESEDSDLMSLGVEDVGGYTRNNNNTGGYINSELVNESTDKIQLNSAADLVSHRHDYTNDTYKEEIYIKRKKRIIEIKKIPQHEQKSKAWLKQRNECLTATAIAIVLDEDPYKHPAELFLDKCNRGEPFIENENVHHGRKYEQIGNMFYSFRNNVKVAEYGLLQHEKFPFIGASPDGICEKNTLETDGLSCLVGRLLEIKFPKTRKININGNLDGDICPHYYFHQIQTQLYVTGMDECDFLQCKIEEYDTWEDFIRDSNPTIPGLSKKTNLEKGCLIQLLPKKMIGGNDSNMCLFNAQYIYPPKLHMSIEETEKWIASEVLNFHNNELSDDYVIDRIIYWKLSQVACHLVKADHKAFESIIPKLKQFWDYVLFFREHPKKLDRVEKFIKENGVNNSADIFSKIHKIYASIHTKTKYKPLYQEENEWRIKYNKKSALYQKNKKWKNIVKI